MPKNQMSGEPNARVRRKSVEKVSKQLLRQLKKQYKKDQKILDLQRDERAKQILKNHQRDEQLHRCNVQKKIRGLAQAGVDLSTKQKEFDKEKEELQSLKIVLGEENKSLEQDYKEIALCLQQEQSALERLKPLLKNVFHAEEMLANEKHRITDENDQILEPLRKKVSELEAKILLINHLNSFKRKSLKNKHEEKLIDYKKKMREQTEQRSPDRIKAEQALTKLKKEQEKALAEEENKIQAELTEWLEEKRGAEAALKIAEQKLDNYIMRVSIIIAQQELDDLRKKHKDMLDVFTQHCMKINNFQANITDLQNALEKNKNSQRGCDENIRILQDIQPILEKIKEKVDRERPKNLVIRGAKAVKRNGGKFLHHIAGKCSALTARCFERRLDDSDLNKKPLYHKKNAWYKKRRIDLAQNTVEKIEKVSNSEVIKKPTMLKDVNAKSAIELSSSRLKISPVLPGFILRGTPSAMKSHLSNKPDDDKSNDEKIDRREL